MVGFGICPSFVAESGDGDLVCSGRYWARVSSDPGNAMEQQGTWPNTPQNSGGSAGMFLDKLEFVFGRESC
jgi:hypothetical protein